MPTLGEALNTAMEHHQRGELREAEHIYRQILAVAPDEPDVWHRLGLLALQLQKHQLAIEYINKSIDLDPKQAAYRCNLGVAYRDYGRIEDAIKAYREAIRVDPQLAEAHNNLGVLHKEHGRFDEAIELLQEAVRLHPQYLEANFNLAQALHARGDFEGATPLYQRVLQLAPQDADAHNSYGLLLQQTGRPEPAWQHYQRALQLRPTAAEFHYNLGLLMQEQGSLGEAVAAYREAVRLNPKFAAAFNNLGIVLTDVSRFDPSHRQAAIAAFTDALKIQPKYPEALNNRGVAQAEQGQYTAAINSFRDSLKIHARQAEAHNNLGNALKDQGKLDNAIAEYEAALEIDPNYTAAQSNLLMAMHYSPIYTPEELSAAAIKFGAGLAERITPLPPAANDRNPDRRLRLGYVGADLRRNPVGYFLEAVLASHNRAQVEVFLYANQSVNDDLTDRLVQHAHHWRKVVGFDDDALAKIIRDDKIDILIDLSGHTGKHRLLTFARKPAPIQATWMGYFATTGMPAIDYIIADRFVIPTVEESQYAERVLHLPDSYLCFTPPEVPLEVGPLPAESRGFVTFGCFNNLAKITLDVIKTWARILESVPESQLFLKYKPLADAGTRDYFRNRFQDFGANPHHIRLEESAPRASLLASYNEVDIGLDPFPFNGGTTTAEALWMGVPVVTMRGSRFVSHVGESFLTTAGQGGLVTNNPEEYVARATALARDLPALAARRKQLRTEFLSSPLCDGPKFVRGFEAALRDAWRRWCAQGEPAHSDHT